MSRLLHHRRILSSFFVRNFWLPAESTTSVLPHKYIPPPPHPDLHRTVKLPPVIPSTNSDRMLDFTIEVVDHDLWPASSSSSQTVGVVSGSGDDSLVAEECADLDTIDDLRLHKKLFYKLDRDSKEFEEYNINFHHKKTMKKKKKKQDEAAQAEIRKESKQSEKLDPSKKLSQKKKAKELEKPDRKLPSKGGVKNLKQKNVPSSEVGKGSHTEVTGGVSGKPLIEVKKVRTPTFNQITDPYHLPFCLDIFITKGSVRACIVHRITSKVVAVAHSISKDMKFDLDSRKDARACVAVGGVLAQRAIEDDIHNVVYTPRKGDKIEGKLQIVLQSIIDNGVDVKVKLKQRRHVKV